MSWAHIDDQSPFHPKVVSAGNAAWGALVRMIAWSNAQLTDGSVPKAVARLIGTTDELASLEGVGLIEMSEVEIKIHDFLDWNFSAKEIRKRRGAKQKAGKAGGLASGEARKQSHSSGEAPASGSVRPKSNPSSSPDPDPDPLKTKTPPVGGPGGLVLETTEAKPRKTPKKASTGKTTIPADFAVSPAVEAMCRERGLPDPHVVFEDFRDKAKAKPYLYADWEAAFRGWMRSKITRESYAPWSESDPNMGIKALPKPEVKRVVAPGPPPAAQKVLAEFIAQDTPKWIGADVRLQPKASST